MNEINELNERLQFFLDNNIRVHIDLFDGIFLNGFIVRNSKENIWIMNEEKLGEMILFTKSIAKLQQFLDKGEGRK